MPKDGVLLVESSRAISLTATWREWRASSRSNVFASFRAFTASLSARPLFSQVGFISRVRVPGHESDLFSPPHLPVSPGFFDTMRIRLIAGRDFIPSDSEPLEPTAVIVNEAFARRYFDPAFPIVAAMIAPANRRRSVRK